MRGQNAGVDHVGGDITAARVVENVVVLASFGMGDADEPGRGVGLRNGNRGLDCGIRLYISHFLLPEHAEDHLVVGLEGDGAPRVEVERQDVVGQYLAREGALSQAALLDGRDDHGLLGVDGGIGKAVVVDNDVAVRDLVLGLEIGYRHADEGTADAEGEGRERKQEDEREEAL